MDDDKELIVDLYKYVKTVHGILLIGYMVKGVKVMFLY